MALLDITNIPDHIKNYAPVIVWLLRLFEDHTEIGTEYEVHQKINRLLTLYQFGENSEKLAFDLAQSDFWHIRTMALCETEPPEYWSPIDETFKQFKARNEALNKVIKTNHKLGSNPPTDIILVNIRTILETGKHKLLNIEDYQSSYSI